MVTFMLVLPPAGLRAQAVVLPPAGQKVALSLAFEPSALSAMTVDPNDPLKLEFFVSQGQEVSVAADRSEEYLLLIKDFMTALTVPENQLWVNLSPYEKDRVIDESFGLTPMGRDLLAQDYMLKQVTASLLYPEEGVGRTFWAEVYARAQDIYGTTDIPVDTFNKVWIMPDVAEVYQQGTSAMVLKSRLKVMLESDYLAGEEEKRKSGEEDKKDGTPDPEATGLSPHFLGSSFSPASDIAKDVLRSIIIPVLEKEVNEGKNFARLRQIYNALILAAWYKKSMRDTFLGKTYADKNKVVGIEQDDPEENQRIWAQYVEAYRKGAFNYIKDEVDLYTGETIPRKYLSGGWTAEDFSETTLRISFPGDGLDHVGKLAVDRASKNDSVKVDVSLDNADNNDELTSRNGFTIFGNDQKSVFYQKGRDELSQISKMVALIHQIQDDPDAQIVGSAGKRLKKLNAELDAKLHGLFKDMIAGEESEKELTYVFEQILKDETREPGLRSLIRSGAYTEKALKYFLALSWISRKKEPVPFDKILDVLGVVPEVKASLLLRISDFTKPEDFEGFYKQLLSYEGFSVVFDQSKSNFFEIPSIDHKDALASMREKKLNIPQEKEAQESWLAERARYANALFGKAYRLLHALVASNPVTRNLLFVRVKTLSKALGKLKKDEVRVVNGDYDLRDRKKDPAKIFDWLGGRNAVDGGLSDLFKVGKSVLSPSMTIDFEEYNKRVEQKRKQIMAELNAAKMQNKTKKVAALEREMADILDAMENYKDFEPDKSRLVLVSMANGFNGKEAWLGFYKAIHFLFMLRDRLWTVEWQLKTLGGAIVGDLEHFLGYKREENEKLSLHQDSVNLFFLLDIVELTNYSYEKNKAQTLAILESYSHSQGKDFENVQKTDDKAEYGGIDVRDVNAALAVKGQPAQFNAGEPEAAIDGVEGYAPEILSVTRVQGLPFLNEVPSS